MSFAWYHSWHMMIKEFWLLLIQKIIYQKIIIYHHYSACEEEMPLHLADGYRIIHHVSLIVCLEFKARLNVQVH